MTCHLSYKTFFSALFTGTPADFLAIIAWRMVIRPTKILLEGPACQVRLWEGRACRVRYTTFDYPSRLIGHDRHAPPTLGETRLSGPFCEVG